jgi:hypothetical protein
MDGPCSTGGSDSAGEVHTEHKNGTQRNAVSTQSSEIDVHVTVHR